MDHGIQAILEQLRVRSYDRFISSGELALPVEGDGVIAYDIGHCEGGGGHTAILNNVCGDLLLTVTVSEAVFSFCEVHY